MKFKDKDVMRVKQELQPLLYNTEASYCNSLASFR